MAEKEYLLIPFGTEFIALSQEIFNKALERGRRIMQVGPSQQPEVERLLDSDEAAKLTAIPSSWFLEAARQGRIPHIRAGKYVRIRMSDIIQALEIRPVDETKNFS